MAKQKDKPTQQAKDKQKIVIVGGGFAGVKVALNLAGDDRFDVTLISDKPHFEYHPGLYRTATGKSPLEITVSLTKLFQDKPNVTFVIDKISKIDNDRQTVVSATGHRHNYDELILAVGNVTNYFGIRGLKEFSLGMKSVSEALELKERLHDELLEAQRESDDEPIRYVVVGGGATGVELSAELRYYLRKLCKQHDIDTSRIRVYLIEAADQILPRMPEPFAKRVKKRLERLGVVLYLRTIVKGESKDRLQLPFQSIKTDTVIWTAGVTPNKLYEQQGDLFTFTKSGHIEVDEHLNALPGVYVIGDNADTEYSGLAQTALRHADFVTDNLKRRAAGEALIAYSPKKPVHVIPVGSHWAAVEWGKWHFYGYKGWVLRRIADLKLLITFIGLFKAIPRWQRGNMPIPDPCPMCTSRAQQDE